MIGRGRFFAGVAIILNTILITSLPSQVLAANPQNASLQSNTQPLVHYIARVDYNIHIDENNNIDISVKVYPRCTKLVAWKGSRLLVVGKVIIKDDRRVVPEDYTVATILGRGSGKDFYIVIDSRLVTGKKGESGYLLKYEMIGWIPLKDFDSGRYTIVIHGSAGVYKGIKTELTELLSEDQLARGEDDATIDLVIIGLSSNSQQSTLSNRISGTEHPVPISYPHKVKLYQKLLHPCRLKPYHRIFLTSHPFFRLLFYMSFKSLD